MVTLFMEVPFPDGTKNAAVLIVVKASGIGTSGSDISVKQTWFPWGHCKYYVVMAKLGTQIINHFMRLHFCAVKCICLLVLKILVVDVICTRLLVYRIDMVSQRDGH